MFLPLEPLIALRAFKKTPTTKTGSNRYSNKKHYEPGDTLYHLRIRSQYRNDTWLLATGNNHNTHPQHRRDSPANIPHDGDRRAGVCHSRPAAQRRHNMVNGHYQCSHMHM